MPYSYENSYIKMNTDFKHEKSDAKASITIDAFPIEQEDDEGHVVAEIFLTMHDDIIIAWHDNGERMNPSVLELIDNSIQTLQEFKTKPVTHPAEKAIRNFINDMQQAYIEVNMFGKDIPIIAMSALTSYLETHMHDFYNYATMTQPDVCLHYPSTPCRYPITDCKHCPAHDGPCTTTCCFK